MTFNDDNLFSSSELLSTDTDEFSSNVTFRQVSNSRLTMSELEIRRAMIYNYLVSSGMPFASGLSFSNGLAALFQVGSAAESIRSAISSILANPNEVPSLSVASVNINGRSFFLPSTVVPGSTGSPIIGSSPGNATGLIVGLVVGLVAGALLVVGIVLIIRARRRATDERSKPYELAPIPPSPVVATAHPEALLPITMTASPTNYPVSPATGRYNPRPYRAPSTFDSLDDS